MCTYTLQKFSKKVKLFFKNNKFIMTTQMKEIKLKCIAGHVINTYLLNFVCNDIDQMFKFGCINKFLKFSGFIKNTLVFSLSFQMYTSLYYSSQWKIYFLPEVQSYKRKYQRLIIWCVAGGFSCWFSNFDYSKCLKHSPAFRNVVVFLDPL